MKSLSPASIAHPIGCAKKRLDQSSRQGGVYGLLGHGLRHAPHPLVAFFDAYGVGHVARSEHGMTKAVGVVLRATQPAAQKPKEFVA